MYQGAVADPAQAPTAFMDMLSGCSWVRGQMRVTMRAGSGSHGPGACT